MFVSRDDLGEEGLDDGAIERLGERIAESRAQQASVSRELCPVRAPASERDAVRTIDSTDGPGAEPPGPLRESEAGRVLREARERETRELDGHREPGLGSAWGSPDGDKVTGEPQSEAGRLVRDAREREERELGRGFE